MFGVENEFLSLGLAFTGLFDQGLGCRCSGPRIGFMYSVWYLEIVPAKQVSLSCGLVFGAWAQELYIADRTKSESPGAYSKVLTGLGARVQDMGPRSASLSKRPPGF